MNTRKTVYNKLFSEKTELAKHEVNLYDFKADFTRYLSLAMKTEQNIVNINNQIGAVNKKHREDITKLFKDAKSEVGVYKMMVSTVEKNVEIIKKQANELGLSVEQVPAYKLALEILDKSKYKMIGAYDQKKNAPL